MAKFGKLHEFTEQRQRDCRRILGACEVLLRDLLAPTKPKDKSLDDLFKTLREHHNPTPLVIAERFSFHSRAQSSTESVAEYIAELRRLATHCQFKTFLQEALRDRFVCGLQSKTIQKTLLTEKDLTLDKAVRIAQGLEAAEKGARKLQGDEHSQISRIGKNPKPYKTAPLPHKTCYRCGGEDHASDNCRFRQAECRKCHKKWHIARVCRSGQSKQPLSATSPKSGMNRKSNDSSRKVHQTPCEPPTSESPQPDDV